MKPYELNSGEKRVMDIKVDKNFDGQHYNMMHIECPNFREDGKTFCFRCQKCGLENYSLNVMSGFCSWCGENHNEYKDKTT